MFSLAALILFLYVAVVGNPRKPPCLRCEQKGCSRWLDTHAPAWCNYVAPPTLGTRLLPRSPYRVAAPPVEVPARSENRRRNNELWVEMRAAGVRAPTRDEFYEMRHLYYNRQWTVARIAKKFNTLQSVVTHSIKLKWVAPSEHGLMAPKRLQDES